MRSPGAPFEHRVGQVGEGEVLGVEALQSFVEERLRLRRLSLEVVAPRHAPLQRASFRAQPIVRSSEAKGFLVQLARLHEGKVVERLYARKTMAYMGGVSRSVDGVNGCRASPRLSSACRLERRLGKETVYTSRS